MAVFKPNFCSLWSILVVFLLLSIDECQGQSSSGGVNIVAVIISVIVIVLLICLSMPVCIICLVIALVCTCTKYKKAQKSTQAVDSKVENLLPQTSIHHLPLPPIPTDAEETAAEYEYTSELKVEANQAYGMNLTNDAKNRVAYDSNPTTEANRAYGSNLTTEPNKPCEVNSATEVDQAYELDGYIDIIASDSDLKVEENKAYGSKLSGEPNNEAAAPSQSTTTHVRAPISTDKNIAYGQHNQLAPQESDMYEYI